MSAVVGTEQLIQKLKRINEQALAVANAPEIRTLLEKRVLGRFDEGVSPSGSPWAGLMASTISRKSRAGYKKPEALLQATMRLRKSIGIIQGPGAGLLASSTGMGFRIGVRDPYAARYGRVHNYGLGGQEKRQFLGLGATDVRAVRDFLNRRKNKIVGG